MDVSICILSHNQPTLLPQCVEAGLAEIAGSGIVADIIIVDNASKDAYPAKLAARSRLIRVVRTDENLGFGSANNTAIRLSNGQYVLILNDDAILNEGSLGLMLRALDSRPEVGALGPMLLNPDGSLQVGFTHKRFPRIRGTLCDFFPWGQRLYKRAWARAFFTEWNDAERTGETDYVAGACLLARRTALNSVNLFDEGFYYNFEDADLCYRLKRAGWDIFYLAEARVTHYGSSSFKQLRGSQTYAIYLRSLLRFFRKHSNPGKTVLLRMTLSSLFFLRLSHSLLLRVLRGKSSQDELSDSIRAYLAGMSLLLLEWSQLR